LELEHANNRIGDLELEAARYRRGLQLTCTELGISSADVLQCVEQGFSSLKGKMNVPTRIEETPCVAVVEEGKNEEPVVEEEEESFVLNTFPAVVLYEYSARKTHELSLIAEEKINVISKHENGWWLGVNSAGDQGYFPASYVRPLNEENADPPPQ
jgi:hypothetical protein